MNFDEVKVGAYQILTLLLISVNFIVVGMSHALGIFYKYKPEFHCQGDVSNVTSVCPSTECSQGIAFVEVNRTSVANEWQLICKRDYLQSLIGDVYFIGMLLGGIVTGFLMDRIGRMPILASCLYAQGTMSVALNVVRRYELFLLFRGLQGFFVQGLESSAFILIVELFPTRHRTLVSLIALTMRSIGLALLAGLDYLVLDWRVLQLIVSIPTALSVLYIWLIPESARWLLSRRKIIDAEMVIERIAYYNDLFSWKSSKETVPEKPKRRIVKSDDDDDDVECNVETDVEKSTEAENLLETEAIAEDDGRQMDRKTDEIACLDEKDRQSNRSYQLMTEETENVETTTNERKNGLAWILRFFEARFIGTTCLILACSWFVCSVAFHALITLPRMKIERHASLAIAATVEIVTFVFGYLLISSRFGRRLPLSVAQFVAGIVCIIVAVLAMIISEQTDDWIVQGRLAIVKIGAIANIICFFVLRILSIELLPTISRGTGFGFFVAAEMLAGVFTPWFLKLNDYVDDKDVSRISLGVLCVCVAFLTMTLSETVHMKSLPDSVEDAKSKHEKRNNDETNNEQSKNPEKLRKKLFSEDWVDAGNGIIVNFTENKTVD